MRANYGENEIRSLLRNVKIFNQDIGEYQLYVVNDDFNFLVKLSNGKIAIKIEELQDNEKDALTAERLKEIASRFVPSNPKDKIDLKEKQKKDFVEEPVLSKRKSRRGLIYTLIVLLLVIVSGGIIVFLNNPNSIPGVKLEINTPSPIVVTSRADGSKSSLLKQRTTVYATVLNQGGDGNVLVTFHVYQDGNSYDRTQPIYLQANESRDLEVTFDEVKMLAGKITFDVEAAAQ